MTSNCIPAHQTSFEKGLIKMKRFSPEEIMFLFFLLDQTPFQKEGKTEVTPVKECSLFIARVVRED